jgi:hypothetical protein
MLAGLAARLLVCSRPVDLPFAAVTAMWVTVRHPRQLVWFLPSAIVLGAALVGYNRAYLGATGGYYSRYASSLAARDLGRPRDLDLHMLLLVGRALLRPAIRDRGHSAW